jgi:hypothetical protein
MSDRAHLETTGQLPLDVKSAEATTDTPSPQDEGSKHSFIEMGADFEFFTPALAMAIGGFDRDIMEEFVKHHPAVSPDGDPFFIDHAEPFFTGIPKTLFGDNPVDWNRRIYGIQRERWFFCRDWLTGVAFFDPASKAYTRLGFYEIRLIDPIAVRRPGVITEIPRFPVTVIAVSSTKLFAYLDATCPGPPRVRREPPRQDIQVEAAHAGVQEPDPHALHRFRMRQRVTNPKLGETPD